MQEIPGVGKFMKKALQNEDLLSDMFRDITNEDTDHWNPMSENPIIPNSQEEPFDVDNENKGGGGDFQSELVDARDADEEDVQEVAAPSASTGKRPRVGADLKKKAKSTTAIVIQDAITKMSDTTTAFLAKKKEEGVSVQEVMNLVIDCGAEFGSDEHYIATQLFEKKDARQMFMTFPTREIRFNWLRKRYNDKYGK